MVRKQSKVTQNCKFAERFTEHPVYMIENQSCFNNKMNDKIVLEKLVYDEAQSTSNYHYRSTSL